MVCTPAHYRNYDHLAATRAVIEESGRSIVHVVVDEERPAAADGAPTARPSGSATSWPAHGERRRDASTGPRLAAPPPGAVSELIFTSGTEAAPKAIMHTEQTANFSVRVAAQDLGIGDGDVVWMPSPIGHSTGFNYGVRFALYHGLPLVLQDRWDAGVACDLIAARGASYTLASTTFLQDLVAEAERRGGRDARVHDPLRLRGLAGAARAGAPCRRLRDRGAPPVRVDRGARRHLEPTRAARRARPSTPTGPP